MPLQKLQLVLPSPPLLCPLAVVILGGKEAFFLHSQSQGSFSEHKHKKCCPELQALLNGCSAPKGEDQSGGDCPQWGFQWDWTAFLSR